MADTPKRSSSDVRLLRRYVDRHGPGWRDRLAHDIAANVAPPSLANLYLRERGHLQPLVSPKKRDEEEAAGIARYGDLICAAIVLLGGTVVLQVATTAAEPARSILAELEEAGILRAERTTRTGLRPFHATVTAGCRRRAARLLR